MVQSVVILPNVRVSTFSLKYGYSWNFRLLHQNISSHNLRYSFLTCSSYSRVSCRGEDPDFQLPSEGCPLLWLDLGLPISASLFRNVHLLCRSCLYITPPLKPYHTLDVGQNHVSLVSYVLPPPPTFFYYGLSTRPHPSSFQDPRYHYSNLVPL